MRSREKRFTRSDLMRLIDTASHHKRGLASALLISLLGAALEVARPWPTKVIVDYALLGHDRPQWLDSLAAGIPSVATRQGLVLWSMAVAVILILGSVVASFASELKIFSLAQVMVLDLSRRVFARLQRLSLAFHQKQAVGDLTQRAGADVFVVQAVVCGVAIPAIASTIALVGMTVLMFRLDNVLALITLSMIPLLMLSLFIFNKPMQVANERQWKSQGDIMAFLEQSISSVRLIQGYARERHMEKLMAERGSALAEAFKGSLRVGAIFSKVTVIVTGLIGVVLVGVGSTRVISGRLTLGDLLVFLGYLASLTAPVTAIASAIGTATALSSRGRRVLEILDSEEEIVERKDPVRLPLIRGEIEFRDVSFGYPAEDGEGTMPVFSNISFAAHPGQLTAIVGITGAGKSSMMSLLSRYYDPLSGSVLIDGHDLRDVSLLDLREGVATVSQDPVLFPMTVAENIAFGRLDATREEIIEAARMSCAHDFITRLPKGYDTVLAERGGSLSGGERQRISLARAVLKDAPILILDEPTSSLDAHTEGEILHSLTDYIKSRTTFIISHRLTTIRRADQILSLENGKIVERGRHEDLLSGRGVYSRLYDRQNIAAI